MSEQKNTASQFVTRETLTNKVVQELVRKRGDGRPVLSEEELLASRRAVVSDDYNNDIWVFAYGSLLWNPIFDVADRMIGRIYGYHRRFCLQTIIGRGSPEQPGLVLGLDQGGSCNGMALKIAADNPINELDLLWRREMLNASYEPKWITVHTRTNHLKALTFVMRRDHHSYVRNLTPAEKARMIATAKGFAGSGRDYLIETRKALSRLSIHDRYIETLYQMVLKHP